jgi:hypothetical protein
MKLKFSLLSLIIILGCLATHAQILLRNNFDTSSAPLGTGWVNQVQAGSMSWSRATSTNYTSPYFGGPYAGSGMCKYDSWNQNVPGVSWLISPAIATSTITSGNAVTVSFWALRHSNSSSSTEMRMSVWVGNSNNKDLVTPLDSVYAHNSRYPNTTVNGGWVKYTYNVPSTLLSGANLFFFFRANTDWWNNFFMDEIEIQGVAPMTYSQTIVAQASSNAVIIGSKNNPIIVGKIVSTGSTNPLNTSTITFNTSGTTNLGNISNAKCFFTGNSPEFNTSQQFGSTITSPSGNMVFTGNTLLSSTANLTDTNYFWLTYDISMNAPALNIVNGSMSTITINNINRTPNLISNPGSGRIIRIPNVPSNVPINGLVGYWPFTGNAIDSSFNGNNGTVNGATLTTDRNGEANKAYSFNGTSNDISILTNNTLQPVNEISISAWMKLTSTQLYFSTVFQLRYEFYNDPYVSYSIGSQNQIFRGGISNGSVGSLTNCPSNSPYPLNNWIFVTLTFDGSKIKWYENGVLKNSVDKTGNIGYSNLHPVLIGGDGIGDYFTGHLDDIGMWNRALSENEIKRLYNPAGIFVQPKNIVTRTPGSGSFIVQTVDSGVTYQWQINTGTGFANLSNSVQYSGVNNDTLFVSNILQSNHNQQFRCLTTAGLNRDTSNIAKIIIPNVADNVPVNGLVGYWPFTGNAADSSGNGNNLVIDNASLTIDRNSFTNSAYSFNGFSSSLTTPLNLETFPGVTISIWGNIVGNQNIQTLLNLTSANQQNAFGINYSQNVEAVDAYASPNSLGSIGVSKNVWNHYVISFDFASSITKFFCNGILIGVTTSSINSSKRTELNIGRHHSDSWGYGWFFNGSLDEVGIWNRALSENEIKNLYNRAAIYVQPKNIITKVNSSGSFIVQTADSGITYQWQTNTGSGFTNLSNGGQFNGVNNDTLLVSNILQTNNNQQFRCLTFASLDKDTSSIAKIIVANVPQYVSINGLLGWWPFTGNAIDSSGNGNNGTVYGSTLTTDRKGSPNKAYSFNGTSNLIALPKLTGITNLQKVTFSFWENLQNQGCVFSQWSMGNPSGPIGLNAKILNNGSVHCEILGGIGQSSNSGLFTTNSWNHIVLQFDGTKINSNERFSVFVNGVFKGSFGLSSTPSIIGNQSDSTVLGAAVASPFWDYLNGKLDDIGIWDRILTQEEIANLYISCEPKAITFTVSACNSYTWSAKGNKLYTSSNNADTLMLKTVGGCDSIVTLNLTIKAVKHLKKQYQYLSKCFAL